VNGVNGSDGETSMLNIDITKPIFVGKQNMHENSSLRLALEAIKSLNLDIIPNGPL
jgi:hypothetical protein